LSVGLTGASTAEESYTVHALVQLFSRYWLQHHKQCAEAQLATTALKIDSEFPYSEFKSDWTRYADLMPHVEVILDHQSLFLPTNTAMFCDLLNLASGYLHIRGKYLASEEYARRGLLLATDSRNSSEARDDESLANSTKDLQATLGGILIKNGRFRKAETLLRDSLRGVQAIEKG
jgi:hypothetical protein